MREILTIIGVFFVFAIAALLVDSHGLTGHTIEDGQCLCPADMDPICGDDGQNYPNACFAACMGAKPVAHGNCWEG